MLDLANDCRTQRREGRHDGKGMARQADSVSLRNLVSGMWARNPYDLLKDIFTYHSVRDSTGFPVPDKNLVRVC